MLTEYRGRHGHAAETGRRRVVDDPAAARFLHVPAHDLVGVDGRPQVRFEGLLELVLGDVLGRRAALDAGDVGEHVEAPEPRDAPFHDVVELRRPDVAVLEEHVTAERGRLLGDTRTAVGVDVHREHAGTLAGEGTHRRRAHAARAAGEDDAAAVEDAQLSLSGRRRRPSSRRTPGGFGVGVDDRLSTSRSLAPLPREVLGGEQALVRRVAGEDVLRHRGPRCASSGPSMMLIIGAVFHMPCSGVRSVTPSAPCTCCARQTTSRTTLATVNLQAISVRASWVEELSIFHAVYRTISRSCSSSA